MTGQPHKHEGPPTQRVVQVPDVPILADWGHADCVICTGMTSQPRGHVEPMAAVRPPVRSLSEAADMKDLRGEALRRAWLNASYQVGAKEVPAVSVRALAKAYALAAVCWAIIFGGAWLIWRAF
jgi:hypothetical protein